MADENNYEIIQDSHSKLKLLLRNLFQFDTSDLDFGIYRIMHHKKKEIEKFIEIDLMGEIKNQFQGFAASSLGEKEKRTEELREKIREDLGEDKISKDGDVDERYHDLTVVRDYDKAREELKSANLTQNQVNDVFSLVHEFFSRYFDKGDFLSKRRYGGKNQYTIPYNGEEVLLLWANRDQYYVKTGEHFRNYSFNVGNSQVSFKIKEAETESNNNKGDNRYFVLADEDAIQEDENRSLTVWFQYRALLEEEKKKYGTRGIQDELLKDVVKRVGIENYGLKTALLRKDEKDIPLFEKHLKRYVDRNTTDYFIHKDLRGFLNRELEFFIKNEMLDLDEMEAMDEQQLKISMARAKAIRGICQKVIDFLAQIEDFQKRLFEKKKFVTKTDYCLTLDRVNEDFYEEIGNNEKQVEDWKRLFRLDEITNESFERMKGKKTFGADYLKSHKSLVLDTKFFSQDFKDRLLARFNDIDEETGGLIIKSENFQALNLLREKYREKVKCIYIDPPYNTGNDEFIYKDNYRHSSWLTMMENRLPLAKSYLTDEGAIFISIDEKELPNLLKLTIGIFKNEPIAEYIWKGRTGQAGTIKAVSYQHEYVVCHALNSEKLQLSMDERTRVGGNYKDEKGNYSREQLRQWGQADRREDRPKMWFGIPNPKINNELVFPIKDDGSEGRWRVGEDKAIQLVRENELDFELKNGIWQVYRKIREGKKTYSAKGTILEVAGTTAEGTKTVQSLFGWKIFNYPKPTELVKAVADLIISDDIESTVLDFFAGSGTTAHAILNLNMEDEGNRKYILVEMGDYFDTVMKPRIQKVMYSKEWKDGKPNSNEGISHMFKYQYLEQYEDTLNNIALSGLDRKVQETLEGFDDYFLRYMLDYETRESPTRLAGKQFETPLITNSRSPVEMRKRSRP